ncbi:MAG: ACT domain-containing protein, partial [Pirellulales bacterium]
IPDTPGTSLTLFSKIAARAVAVDMIVQNVGAKGLADISFTVPRDDLRATRDAVEEARRELGAAYCAQRDDVSKVSVVGLGMARQTGVADRMFRALAEAGVNILMIATSEIKISVLVNRDQGAEALRAVHRAFTLEHEPSQKAESATAAKPAPRDALAIVTRLQGMEDLTITDIALDESQARVTIAGVPDRPGIAARVFEGIAAGGLFVDMIVQSLGHQEQASMSFTVPRADLKRALELVNGLAQELGCGAVSGSPRIAKLSVSGVGLRSHTDVAIRMFRALAGAGINVEMINTSEVRVNVVVDGQKGQAGLKALQAAFADVRG